MRNRRQVTYERRVGKRGPDSRRSEALHTVNSLFSGEDLCVPTCPPIARVPEGAMREHAPRATRASIIVVLRS